MRTPSLKEASGNTTPLDDYLSRYMVNLDEEVREPDIILGRNEIKAGSAKYQSCRLFTAGNFSVITGKGKAKKTFLISLLTSMIVSGVPSYGFEAIKCDTVIFDTEQGDFDAWNVGNRIKRLSETDQFRMFALRDMSHEERLGFIESYIQTWNPKFIVIDGIADLVNSINDEGDANRIVELLLRLTKRQDCHIICVIHQNKADSFATGFLGSSLIKKAEIVISIDKVRNSTASKVSCEYIRGSVDFNDFHLEISDGLPVIVDLENEDPVRI